MSSCRAPTSGTGRSYLGASGSYPDTEDVIAARHKSSSAAVMSSFRSGSDAGGGRRASDGAAADAAHARTSEGPGDDSRRLSSGSAYERWRRERSASPQGHPTAPQQQQQQHQQQQQPPSHRSSLASTMATTTSSRLPPRRGAGAGSASSVFAMLAEGGHTASSHPPPPREQQPHPSEKEQHVRKVNGAGSGAASQWALPLPERPHSLPVQTNGATAPRGGAEALLTEGKYLGRGTPPAPLREAAPAASAPDPPSTTSASAAHAKAASSSSSSFLPSHPPVGSLADSALHHLMARSSPSGSGSEDRSRHGAAEPQQQQRNSRPGSTATRPSRSASASRDSVGAARSHSTSRDARRGGPTLTNTATGATRTPPRARPGGVYVAPSLRSGGGVKAPVSSTRTRSSSAGSGRASSGASHSHGGLHDARGKLQTTRSPAASTTSSGRARAAAPRVDSWVERLSAPARRTPSRGAAAGLRDGASSSAPSSARGSGRGSSLDTRPVTATVPAPGRRASASSRLSQGKATAVKERPPWHDVAPPARGESGLGSGRAVGGAVRGSGDGRERPMAGSVHSRTLSGSDASTGDGSRPRPGSDTASRPHTTRGSSLRPPRARQASVSAAAAARLSQAGATPAPADPFAGLPPEALALLLRARGGCVSGGGGGSSVGGGGGGSGRVLSGSVGSQTYGTSRLDLTREEDLKELYRQRYTVDPLLQRRPGKRQIYVQDHIGIMGLYGMWGEYRSDLSGEEEEGGEGERLQTEPPPQQPSDDAPVSASYTDPMAYSGAFLVPVHERPAVSRSSASAGSAAAAAAAASAREQRAPHTPTLSHTDQTPAEARELRQGGGSPVRARAGRLDRVDTALLRTSRGPDGVPASVNSRTGSTDRGSAADSAMASAAALTPRGSSSLARRVGGRFTEAMADLDASGNHDIFGVAQRVREMTARAQAREAGGAAAAGVAPAASTPRTARRTSSEPFDDSDARAVPGEWELDLREREPFTDESEAGEVDDSASGQPLPLYKDERREDTDGHAHGTRAPPPAQGPPSSRASRRSDRGCARPSPPLTAAQLGGAGRHHPSPARSPPFRPRDHDIFGRRTSPARGSARLVPATTTTTTTTITLGNTTSNAARGAARSRTSTPTKSGGRPTQPQEPLTSPLRQRSCGGVGRAVSGPVRSPQRQRANATSLEMRKAFHWR